MHVDATGVRTMRPALAPFQVLGVSPTATPAQVNAAYRTLAQIFHPDRYHDSPAEVRRESEALMTALNQAYADARKGFLAVVPVPRGGGVPTASDWTVAGRQAFTSVPWDEAVRRRVADAARFERARQARERAKPQGQAVGKPRRPQQGAKLSGLGMARVTGNVVCAGCHSVQWLPSDWREQLDDLSFHCSLCDRLIFTR